MSDDESWLELLTSCAQDLRCGAEALAAALPGLAPHVRAPALHAEFDRLCARLDVRAGRWREHAVALGGPANLWMAGIVEDGFRDSRTIAPGPLLDIALVGAIRKGLASEFVSGETAICVARRAGRDNVGRTAAVNRADCAEDDARLAALLAMLADEGR